MTEKILIVDDEPSLLGAIQRALRDKFEVHTAGSGEAGLRCFNANGPFPVVVSDFQMPRMDGVTFLSKILEMSPDTVRIMLTGHAERETTIRAVNEGNIFRFLSKPCPMDVLEKALRDALRQYRLVQTEREYYSLKKWNESLAGLVQAFSRLIESKDPYTAGHQQRVALISVDLAGMLGLSDKEVEQVRMAALIHDIGKIYVPAEFLNKPGRLNPAEWAIVKMHSQVGHDIINPLDFPFPIHEIVLQHHERIDGSGYPLGLRESGIHLESQIIAVADAIEAIAHHRPYRPAKGIGEAISEITANRGTKYNEQICDAALKLISENRLPPE